MLPPHQPPRRRKAERNKPVKTAVVASKAKGGAPVVQGKPAMRVLGRAAPVPGFVAARRQRLKTC